VNDCKPSMEELLNGKDPKPTATAAAESAPFGDYGWVVVALGMLVVVLVASLCFTCGQYHALKRQVAEAEAPEIKGLCDDEDAPPQYVPPVSIQ
jgi:hypothetical protein